ncbi:MAG TPA: DUF4846 domain-containing protein, partial [Flavobacteriales bacterium]|nr:DUF4846 domain-containing protein [Flavobacteriales bacterium]
MTRYLIMLLALATNADTTAQTSASLVDRFPPPPGAKRDPCAPNSFGAYLRGIPLLPADSPVLLHNGMRKWRQDVHAAVLDVSVGTKDLQQCADAVMRLRAEHLFAVGRQDEIAFNLTNGFRVDWARWRKGSRMRVTGNRCTWTESAKPDSSHKALLSYLDFIFTYAGSLSLSLELMPGDRSTIEAGDVIIQGGSPGHAVIVLETARDDQGQV